MALAGALICLCAPLFLVKVSFAFIPPDLSAYLSPLGVLRIYYFLRAVHHLEQLYDIRRLDGGKGWLHDDGPRNARRTETSNS